MQNLQQTISNLAHKDLSERKTWYSAAAEAYNQVRPHYPQSLIERVVNLAQLNSASQLLEVGCGPGTATVAFAPLGCSITCLEPNADFVALAQQNCAAYTNVQIENLAFEEWQPAGQRFDAVLATSSFHWIPAEIGYPKAAELLKPEGTLILLWNKELQPSRELYESFLDLYQTHAPALIWYEEPETQLAIIQAVGQMAVESGQFSQLDFKYQWCQATYSAAQYLRLLSTYSPQIALPAANREQLFAGIQARIEQQGGQIDLTYLSACHLARR
ncbi:MAG: class I SAM-dependent methyltransferase [Elainella sp.]